MASILLDLFLSSRWMVVFLFLIAVGVESAARCEMSQPSCDRSDPRQICLALKYGVYQDAWGEPVVSRFEAAANIHEVDQLWKQCKIGFEIESFVKVDPSRVDLNFGPSDSSELDRIRKRLDDSAHLLVVTTGPWNRAGTLGWSPANAWTAMPGENFYGAILEKPVGTYSNIIAHELGHYLNLDHVSDARSLMNPVIYDQSTYLSQGQCESARIAVQEYWQKMVRR
jgi:hypothetical protein